MATCVAAPLASSATSVRGWTRPSAVDMAAIATKAAESAAAARAAASASIAARQKSASQMPSLTTLASEERRRLLEVRLAAEAEADRIRGESTEQEAERLQMLLQTARPPSAEANSAHAKVVPVPCSDSNSESEWLVVDGRAH
eukprot:TRINITY_DN29428_c0_g1_i1.p1 TRINITY_DN29428_c0_g1~~TRINITY_DN29428_c0_g1_i1.p1  ORF type:complete len:143 (-),score=31.49 TRINITY_DN29428_c0_g1_i1:89-517(-)